LAPAPPKLIRFPPSPRGHSFGSQDNTDILTPTAKARQSEQGDAKRGGIDFLVMPPQLKGRLPLWRVCSVELLRGLVKPRN